MTYYQSLAAGSTPTGASLRPAPSSGVFGWLGNLWHDTEQMASGLAGLGGQVVHDVGRSAALALPGHQTWGFINDTDPTGYHVDDIVKALPHAIAHDYASRYGSIQDVQSGLYNHPLSYLLDLLSVGSMVGKGAEILGTASLASDAGESVAGAVARGVGKTSVDTGSSALETAASKARELMAPGTMTPGLTRKVANPAGIRAGLEQLATERPLGPFEDLARRILPSESVKKVGEDLVPTVARNNPIGRLIEAPFHYAATESLDRLRATVDSAGNEISEALARGEEVPPTVTTRFAQLKGQLTGAEQAGVTRLQRPVVSDAYARYASAKLVGAVRGLGLNIREQRFHDVGDYVKSYVKNDTTGTFVDRAHGVMQGLDTTVQELPEHPGAVNMDVVMNAPRTVSLNVGKRPITTEIAPEARDWLAQHGPPGIVDRIDAAVTNVREAVDRYTKAPDTIPEGHDIATVTDAADRYISNLYDAATRKYAGSVPGGADIADTIQATDDLRIMLSGENWEGSMLRRGNASPESLMRRMYAPLMRKYGAEISDEGKLLMPDGSDWRQFDDAFRASGQAPPVYFKLMDDNKFAPTNYRDFVFSNARIGARRATHDPSLRRMEGNLLKSGSYAKDPVEVFTRRAAQQTRYEEVQNLIEWAIKPNARRVGSLDEVMDNEGYYIPDQLRRTFASHMKFDDMRADLTARGVHIDDATAAGLKSVVFKNQDELINRGITTKGAEIYAIPKALANHLDSYAKYALNNPAIRIFYDGPMNAWRAMVLQGSPRWTLNNLLGNTTFVALSGGANLTDVARIAEERFKAMLNDKFGMQLDTSLLDDLNRVEGMARTGSGFAGTESLYTPKLGGAGETETGKIMQQITGSKPVQTAKSLGSFNQRANAAIEDVFRQAVYLKSLDKTNIVEAAKPVMHGFWDLRGRVNRMLGTKYTPEQVDSALTEMAQVMGNYGALGPIERNVVRRFVFPFWGFYKHQAQFLARLPVEHPLRADVLNAVAAVNQEMLQQYGPMPEWLQGAVPMGPPGTTGDIPFLSTAGPNPFNATFSNPLSQLAPPLQIALSRLEGHNLYTKAPFTDPNVITPFGSDQSFRIIRDAQGNVVNTVPISGAPLPGILEQVLSQIPQYQAVENVVAGGRTYDSANLARVIAARLTGNQASVTPVDTEGAVTTPANVGSELAKLAGAGTYNYNLSDYQRNLMQNQLRALAEAQAR